MMLHLLQKRAGTVSWCLLAHQWNIRLLYSLISPVMINVHHLP